MKSTPLAAACAAALVLLAGGGARAQSKDETAISAYIARQVRQQRGVEYADARKIVTGDLHGDGSEETVVLYTIESQHGSNNYIQFLTVFAHRGGALASIATTEVGGKNNRSVELTAVDRDGIHLDTLAYAANDPSCCPTIKGTATYVLAGRALKPAQHRAAAAKPD